MTCKETCLWVLVTDKARGHEIDDTEAFNLISYLADRYKFHVNGDDPIETDVLLSIYLAAKYDNPIDVEFLVEASGYIRYYLKHTGIADFIDIVHTYYTCEVQTASDLQIEKTAEIDYDEC